MSGGDILARIVAAGVIAALLALSVACEVAVWNECRAAGHSRLVCMRWVTR